MQGSDFVPSSHREASHPRHSVLQGRHTGYRLRHVLLWIAVWRPLFLLYVCFELQMLNAAMCTAGGIGASCQSCRSF